MEQDNEKNAALRSHQDTYKYQYFVWVNRVQAREPIKVMRFET